MRGRIHKALSGFYYVHCDDRMIRCKARGKFRRDGLSPLVGDFVEIIDLGNGEGRVEEILPRRNFFDRPSVANIDQLVIICSHAIPKTDPYLVDRMTAVAALKNCDVLICINKCDLDPAQELSAYYTAAGFSPLCVSAETGEGLDALRAAIAGKLSAFTGNSGVGKSSILNALDPGIQIQVGEVSRALGRGRHTTRHSEIMRLDSDTYVVDTPGFSALDFEHLDPREVLRLFPDMLPYRDGCKFSSCLHLSEPECTVKQAVADGHIQAERYDTYCKILTSIAERKR